MPDPQTAHFGKIRESDRRLDCRCIFVDAGVITADLDWRKKKEELKALEEQAVSVARHGELALIAVDAPTAYASVEDFSLRPPMLQVSDSLKRCGTYPLSIFGAIQQMSSFSLLC